MAKHKAMVGIELEVLAKKFDRFGWERDRGTPAHDRQMTDWMLVLQDYPLDEIQAACRQAVIDNPNKMPNEGHILAQIIKARAKMVVPDPIAPPAQDGEPPMSNDRRAEVVKELGLTTTEHGQIIGLGAKKMNERAKG